jgi:hypothetical protein
MLKQRSTIEFDKRFLRAHARALTPGQYERASITHAAIIHKTAVLEKIHNPSSCSVSSCVFGNARLRTKVTCSIGARR